MYSTEEIRAKLEERKRIGDEIRAIAAKATAEKRAQTGEESTKVDDLLKRADELKAEADRMSRANGLVEDLSGYRPEPEVAGEENRAQAPADERIQREYGAAFRSWLDARGVSRSELRGAECERILSRPEARSALMVGEGPRAGFLVPPVEFLRELLKDLDREHVATGLVRRIIVPMGRDLSVARRTAKASSFRRGGENAEPIPDTALRYGRLTITPRNGSGEILVSNDLLESEGLIDIESEVRGELALDFGDAIEQEILLGDGAGEALGVFTPHADGIPTSRDVTVGTTTAVTLDGLRNVKYGLRAPYWKRARWLGSQDFHKQVFGLKDEENRPLYQETLREGEPDRLMGMPIDIDEFAPATFTASQYVAALGDWSTYWLAIARDMRIQKLIEQYARQNMTGFLYHVKLHGGPTKAEAFVRATLASG